MTKTDFIEAISKRTGESYASAEGFYNAATNIITEKLEEGEKVQLTGFGSFEVGVRAARQGRNPKTGESIQIPASRYAKFSAGKNLKEALNK